MKSNTRKSNTRKNPIYRSSLVVMILLYTINATAQSQTEDINLLEEVIVTATKRAESVQSIGLSVKAIQGEELQDRGLSDFEDFAVTIPNLSFGATDDGVLANRTISIRGIQGLNTTSVYIDDTPLDESIDPLVLDVERVEVLRGPQGTLYGARGLGGTIKIVTKKPELGKKFGRIHGGLSSVTEGGNNFIVDGAINIPVSDSVATRVTAYYQSESGIFDKVVGHSTAPGVVVATGTSGALIGDTPTTIKDVDDKTIFGAQAALLAEINSKVTLESKLLFQNTKLSGFPLADQVYTNSGGNLLLNGDDFTQERLFNIAEGADDEWIQFSLNVDFELPNGNVTYSGGYFSRETNDYEDSSEFVSFTLFGIVLPDADLPTQETALQSPIYQKLEFNSLVQELRFVSNLEGNNHFIAGLFYQNTDDNEAFSPPNIAPGLDEAFSGFVGAPYPPGALGSDLVFESDTPTKINEIGLYGEFNRNLNKKFSATLGLRYFNTEVITKDYNNGFAAGAEIILPETSQKENGVNIKLLAEYQASESSFIYGLISEGFRIGGSNGPLPETLGCPDQANALGLNFDNLGLYSSDDLISVEVGAKNTIAGGRVTVNGAVFRNSINNIQQRILLGCGFDFIANLGSAVTSGFELETVARINSNFKLQAGIGYTKAEFTKTVSGIVNKGDPLQQVPELTYNLALDYNKPSSLQNYEWLARLDYSFVGKSVSTVVNSSEARNRPAFSLLNIRFGLQNNLNQIVLFIDNATDETAVFSDNRTLAAEAVGRARIVRNRPRTFGFEFRRSF